MNKTGRTKFLKSLLLMALAVVMCLSAMTTGFAAGTGAVEAVNENNPAEAVITKLFQMPNGTVIPNGATFTFNFAKKSYNGDSTALELGKMPTAPAMTVALATGDTQTAASGTATVKKATTDIGANISFPNAGVYAYTVTESASVAPYTPGADEHFAYSQSQYEVTFWVKNHSTSGVYIAAIGVTSEKNDDGTTTGTGKIDLETNADAFAFTNSYYKDKGTVDPSASTALGVKKTVDAASGGDLTKYFDFSVIATRPTQVPAADYPTYKAYIKSGSTILSAFTADHVTADGTDAYGAFYTFTPGTAKSIKLKHNEQLVFAKLPVGATYTATELGAANYTASVSIVADGATAITKNGTLATDLDTDDIGAVKRIIGQNANTAEFTNVFNNTGFPITGINMNNMPFYAILLLVACAFVAFIVVKSRRREARDN